MSTLRRLFGASTAREARSEPGISGGLAPRMAVASLLLALLVGAAFAVMLIAISDLRTSERLVTNSRRTSAAADRLEEHVIDLETGVRGFVIARQERFLEPWAAARVAIPGEASALVRLADRPEQKRRVRVIAREAASYITDYSVPLVNAARQNKPAARSVAATAEGKRRIDGLRRSFDRFRSVERALLTERQRRDDTNAGRAVIAGSVGLAGSVALILVFGGLLTLRIVRPLRRASRLAGELAAGDLGKRMPETSVGEIGALERSFNSMAVSLEKDRNEIRRLADEQAALRRVATLVAQGASSADVFTAVAQEVVQVLGLRNAAVCRFDGEGATMTVLAVYGDHPDSFQPGSQWPLDGLSMSAEVLRTGRPARIEDYRDIEGSLAAEARRAGFNRVAGAPIIVDGRVWGVISTSSPDARLPVHLEDRMAEFTDLVGTAIANAESRAELDASRARIVGTADATRRRIERDLHDGAQQQLVSLALELRAAQASIPAELGEQKAELSHVIEGLTGVLDGLREIALGIHPAILAEGGLGPALKTLARRSPIPVELDLQTEGRLPEPVEVAAYYVVSEALTNAAKYAQASVVHVEVEAKDRALLVAVRDDGVGGADPVGGSGLVGLQDRAEAIGGTISLESPRGAGTSLRVELPLDGASG